MSTTHNPNESPEIIPVHEDLDEIGPISKAFNDAEWIGCGHIYKDVPSVVAAEHAKLLQIPDEYTSLLPKPTDSVDKLLSFALPPAATNTSVAPTFSTEIPSDNFIDILFKHTITSQQQYELEQELGQQWLDGKQSLLLTATQTYLPFWTISFLGQARSAQHTQTQWKAAQCWVSKP
ncbi:hypothetical protein VKT23_011486 [Stygiomarasmius scandens]|uniref:Uncharacterized protein n=1 Tax=Marasmiellus scandens TaxID=2682957 RepID=A0ABR1JB06_9AGAR